MTPGPAAILRARCNARSATSLGEAKVHRSMTAQDADMTSLFTVAQACIAATDPQHKVALTQQSAAAWFAGHLDMDAGPPPAPIGEPGRPARPELVTAQALRPRSPHTAQGRGALVHAIAHIEFNAINLAWDAVYRFRGLPRDYYSDWVRIAREEAEHFCLLQMRLQELGFDYGDFPAHDGLWDMAKRTAHDALERMALVPRVLEARGLDVTPKIMEKLRAAGDDKTCRALEIILRDEIGHVESGTRWFRHLCAERGVDPEHTFLTLFQQYLDGKVRGPLHLDARRRAGFTETELDALSTLAVN